MIDNRTAPYGAFVLRVALGVFGLDGTTQFFVSLGLPAWTAPATILAEAVGGLALVVGLWARLAAVATIPVLLGAETTFEEQMSPTCIAWHVSNDLVGRAGLPLRCDVSGTTPMRSRAESIPTTQPSATTGR